MRFPSVQNLPFLSKDQMVEVDRLMIEKYGISLVQMMENAGRCLAILARDRFLDAAPVGKSVLVMAGPGGNGGGAMVAARRLAAWGVKITLVLSHVEERIKPVPMHQLAILRAMGIPISEITDFKSTNFDLIIDGLIGYSLNGAPRGKSAELISGANNNRAPILALDVPSGLDATSGTAFPPTINAQATLTLALPKIGLRDSVAKQHIGELYCGDISVPPVLYTEPTIGFKERIIFTNSDIVRVI